MITHLVELPLNAFLAIWIFAVIIIYVTGYVYAWRRLAWRIANSIRYGNCTTLIPAQTFSFGEMLGGVAFGGLAALFWPWLVLGLATAKVGGVIHGTGYEFMRPPREVRKRLRQQAREEAQRLLEIRERDLEAWHSAHPSGLAIAAAQDDLQEMRREEVSVDDLTYEQLMELYTAHDKEYPRHPSKDKKVYDDWAAKHRTLLDALTKIRNERIRAHVQKRMDETNRARHIHESQRMKDLERFQKC